LGKSWCCAPPHPLPPPSPCVFPLGKAAVSPVITGWLFEASGLLCLHSVLQSLESHSPPPPSRPVLQKGGTGLCHCSLGYCPGPVCLSVYLSAGVSVRLPVSPCRCRFMVSVRAEGFKMTMLGAQGRDKFTHSSLLASTC